MDKKYIIGLIALALLLVIAFALFGINPTVDVYSKPTPADDTTPESIMQNSLAGEKLTKSTLLESSDIGLDRDASGIRNVYGDGLIVVEIVKTKSIEDANFLVSEINDRVESRIKDNDDVYHSMMRLNFSEKSWVEFDVEGVSGFAWRKGVWFFFVEAYGEDRENRKAIRNKAVNELGY